MSSPPSSEVTQILQAVRAGEEGSSARLLPLVYDELRKLATARMAKLPPGQTLQPTALVHEAYLRLIGNHEPQWDSRGHFFAAAAQAIRNILVEHARRHGRQRHGGGRKRLELHDNIATVDPASSDVLALDEALDRLAAIDKLKSDVVMLRYFAGLTIEETAAALDISTATVDRHWSYAKAWLHRMITGDARMEGE